MHGRFKTNHHAISPFFAFQDIITSAIAILVIIVMFLAVSVGNTPSKPASESNANALRQQLDALLDELEQTNAVIRLLQRQGSLRTTDPAMIKAQIEALQEELKVLAGKNQVVKDQLQVIESNDTTLAVRQEIERKRAVLQEVLRQNEKLKEEAEKSLEEVKKATGEVNSMQAKLLAEQAMKNQLWLIPESSKGGKEPIVVVVADKDISVQRFDKSEKEVIAHGRIQEVLKKHSRADHYFVLYFKPSGVRHFKALTEKVKAEGFDVGYDVLDEEKEINFAPVQ